MAPDVLVADPPWRFADRLPGETRGASKQYSTLSVSEIAHFPLPVSPVCDAVLFLWRVAAMPEEALFVCRAWGFTPKTELVWLKETVTGKRHFGMGRILRAEHETCLVATRGRVAPATRNVRSTFRAPVGQHSEKPDAFYSLVEELFPESTRYELFARKVRTGWQQDGNELGSIE